MKIAGSVHEPRMHNNAVHSPSGSLSYFVVGQAFAKHIMLPFSFRDVPVENVILIHWRIGIVIVSERCNRADLHVPLDTMGLRCPQDVSCTIDVDFMQPLAVVPSESNQPRQVNYRIDVFELVRDRFKSANVTARLELYPVRMPRLGNRSLWTEQIENFDPGIAIAV